MKAYTIEYKVLGVFHDPMNPTYPCSGKNKKEVRKKARKEIIQLESERWGRPVKIHIIGVEPWKKIEVGNFDKFIFPVIKNFKFPKIEEVARISCITDSFKKPIIMEKIHFLINV